jgi:hypothetical protein
MPLFLSLTCSIGFAIASGYSSKVSSAYDNEVLLKGDKCAALSGDLINNLNEKR